MVYKFRMLRKSIIRKVAVVLLSIFVLSCQKEDKVDLIDPNLLSVSFQKANNPSLESDIKLDFDNDDTFSGFIPYGTSIKSLIATYEFCLLYTSPSPRDRTRSRMPSSA